MSSMLNVLLLSDDRDGCVRRYDSVGFIVQFVDMKLSVC
jgi:hypothetical protein